MKYEKAIVKIHDMGNEEILTCSGDIGGGGNKSGKHKGGWPWWPWTWGWGWGWWWG